MWTIIIAICYASPVMPTKTECQQLQESTITYHPTKEECEATFDAHAQAIRQELARQGLMLVQFGARCDQAGDPT